MAEPDAAVLRRARRGHAGSRRGRRRRRPDVGRGRRRRASACASGWAAPACRCACGRASRRCSRWASASASYGDRSHEAPHQPHGDRTTSSPARRTASRSCCSTATSRPAASIEHLFDGAPDALPADRAGHARLRRHRAAADRRHARAARLGRRHRTRCSRRWASSAPSHLAGWSTGGAAIAAYALDRPVASLTFIDPVSPYGYGGTHARRHAVLPRLRRHRRRHRQPRVHRAPRGRRPLRRRRRPRRATC